MKISLTRDVTLCSPAKVNRRFGRTYWHHFQYRISACFILVSALTYSSTLRMEAIRSSETSVYIYQKIRCYISEDRVLHSRQCENLKYTTSTYLYIDTNQVLLFGLA
jgi:hypothetical protein